ncbi:GNAT family N-acetyltransferase [Azospirillum soli]|uniref:GNAT family N-acetyltransferase n=1 Tax=Azospirillum soli TaxID=1304799 RepID=UPI001AE3B843|nr:GNAT family N-acetyltransferase [Azospirillum soli]MBP2312589.1 CelD/BcsL family acetyltransferase involved in cellulose biosynthesis [Azospirillum soli]
MMRAWTETRVETGTVRVPALSSDIRIVSARSGPALEALAAPWAALWRRVPHATPFQHPAWLIPWWRSFGHGDLWVLALYRRVRLVGVIPLYREGDRLLPLGVGITDMLDALVEEDVPLGPVLAAIPGLTGCPSIEFPALAPWSPLLRTAAPPGWSEEGGVTDVCPVLPLPPSAASLGAVLLASQARNLRHTTRRAERAGAIEIEAATAHTAGGMLEDLFRLHAARWGKRGESGVLADPAVQSFHRMAAPALAEAGLLRMHRLRIGGQLAAVHYGFGDGLGGGRRAYYYLGGFDPELAPLGPGVLIVGHAIAEALREGAAEFHFLRGREPYKYRWGALDQPSVTRRFHCGDDA